jgi:hypothetical protein
MVGADLGFTNRKTARLSRKRPRIEFSFPQDRARKTVEAARFCGAG